MVVGFPKPKIAAFTLLELMIAASILAGFFIGVFKIYQSVMRTQEVGFWTQETTTKIRNGLTLLRIEIGKCSKPKWMTQMGIEDLQGVDVTPFEKLKCPAIPPEGLEISDFSTDKALLEFYMCKPGRKDIPGETNSGYEIMMGVFKVEGKKLVYERTMNTNTNVPPSEQTPEMKMVICENPSKLRLELTRNDTIASLSVKLRNSINVEITAQHPKYPRTTLKEEIGAFFEVLPNGVL